MPAGQLKDEKCKISMGFLMCMMMLLFSFVSNVIWSFVPFFDSLIFLVCLLSFLLCLLFSMLGNFRCLGVFKHMAPQK